MNITTPLLTLLLLTFASQSIPGADWPFGFSAVLLAMIGTMAVALWWFRRKGWL